MMRINSLTSRTFENKALQIQWNRGLSREKCGDISCQMCCTNNRKGAKLGITSSTLVPNCVWNDYGSMHECMGAELPLTTSFPSPSGFCH